ncbi:MAG: Hsp20/alpha crystallin family protein [Pseudomonadota bacterium]
MKVESLKENVGALWDNLSEGWRSLTRFAAGALTRFKPGAQTQLPAKTEMDEDFFLPARNWAVLGADLFEDEERLVVRLELPGLDKSDLRIEVHGDMLDINGEKRFERESTQGRWRVMQCAYGSFQRKVPLPVPVRADAARATYKNGVLRVELPKAAPGKPLPMTVPVE